MQTTICITQRNYGIDLLRLLAASYVIMLHTLLRGGVYSAAAPYSYQYFSCQFLLSAAYCCITLFGLISGYVGYSPSHVKHGFVSYGLLWLEVVFYSIAVTVFWVLCFDHPITGSDLLRAFFPVTHDTYWYFTAYTLLVLFIPLLNSAVAHCSDQTLKIFLCFILFAFCPLESLRGLFKSNLGYSFLWLMILYLLGAAMKKLGIGRTVPTPVLLFLIAAITLITFGLYTLIPVLTRKGFDITPAVLEAYTFPTYVYGSMAYLLLFSRLKPSAFFRKLIAFAAPGAFAAYILNVHSLVWKWMHERFAPWGTSSTAGLVIRVVGFSFLFVAAVTVIDHFRRKIFDFLRIKQLLHALAKKTRTC